MIQILGEGAAIVLLRQVVGRGHGRVVPNQHGNRERALLGHVEEFDEAVVGGPLVKAARDRGLDGAAVEEAGEAEDVLAEARGERLAQIRVPRVRDTAAEAARIARILREVPQPRELSLRIHG